MCAAWAFEPKSSQKKDDTDLLETCKIFAARSNTLIGLKFP